MSIAAAEQETPTKTCNECLVTHELAQFCCNAKSEDGLNYKCRACCRAYDQVKWQQTSVNCSRGKDKRRWKETVGDFGESITIERIDDLLVMQQGGCMYCSAMMVYGLGIDRSTHPRAATIERVDNDVPHVITNCVLACHACNSKRVASYTY
jgi:hypothetical protein